MHTPDLFITVPARAPLVVSYGAGVDSTAMLVAMHARGELPDAILFADTGAEKPETYAYLPIIGAWLASVGFPEVTTVRYAPKVATYHTLGEKCLTNETLPSLAYGRHSCALVFKVAPQEAWLRTWAPAVEAWRAGLTVTKCIGYDAGPQDSRRCAKATRAQTNAPDARYSYRYPLQAWGIDRAGCEALILGAGLPLPVKSACYFCPASKKSEILWLRDTHPHLFGAALAIEFSALNGKHEHRSTRGLGRNFAWASLSEVDSSTVVDDLAEQLRP